MNSPGKSNLENETSAVGQEGIQAVDNKGHSHCAVLASQRTRLRNQLIAAASGMQVFLDTRPEDALALRRAPPSHAWLAACRRCCGPETLFAFFEDLTEETEPDNAALACLLRKFQSQGSQVITRGHQNLIIVDGPMPEQLPKVKFNYTTTILLDRRRYSDKEVATIDGSCVQHVICEHARVFGRVFKSDGVHSNAILRSVWLPKATSVGEYAFMECTFLTHISLPVVESIGADAFNYCHSLKSVSLDARHVGDAAFFGCEELRTVSLPLARAASSKLFSRCTRLSSVSMQIGRASCRERV